MLESTPRIRDASEKMSAKGSRSEARPKGFEPPPSIPKTDKGRDAQCFLMSNVAVSHLRSAVKYLIAASLDKRMRRGYKALAGPICPKHYGKEAIMVNKIYNSADEAVADIPDGVSIAMHSWGLCGTPSHLIAAIMRKGVKDITLLCTNFLPMPGIESVLPSPPSLLPQLKKLITPGIGGARIIGTDDKGFLGDRVKTGQLEIEVVPHGIWIERLHAAAMGLGGFYNPVGVGTSIAEGKEKRVIDGVEYLLEKPFRPDVGVIKAHRADKLGNLTYYAASRGSNPIIAMASKLNIAEVDELVEVGEIDPEMIVTAGVYIDRIVKIPEGDVGSAKQKRDLIAMFLENEMIRRLVFGPMKKGGQE